MTDLLLDGASSRRLSSINCWTLIMFPHGVGSRRALFPDFSARDVPARREQRVGLRGHDEVVPVEPADLVGPPGHRDMPPLGEEGGMVTLRLGEGADPVGEGQRVGESWEAEGPLEPGDAVALHHLPVWDLTPELRNLRHSHPGRVAAAGDTSFSGQRAHRTHLSFLDPTSLEKAELVVRGLQVSPCQRCYACWMRSSGTSTRLMPLKLKSSSTR